MKVCSRSLLATDLCQKTSARESLIAIQGPVSELYHMELFGVEVKRFESHVEYT